MFFSIIRDQKVWTVLFSILVFTALFSTQLAIPTTSYATGDAGDGDPIICTEPGVTPNDGIDNDGDGYIDEEKEDCIDNDGDGLVDEDVYSY